MASRCHASAIRLPDHLSFRERRLSQYLDRLLHQRCVDDFAQVNILGNKTFFPEIIEIHLDAVERQGAEGRGTTRGPSRPFLSFLQS